MVVKYRLASAPEDEGAYIATFFLGASFPQGRRRTERGTG